MCSFVALLASLRPSLNETRVSIRVMADGIDMVVGSSRARVYTDTGHKALCPVSTAHTGLMPYFKVEQVLCVVRGEGENTCWVW